MKIMSLIVVLLELMCPIRMNNTYLPSHTVHSVLKLVHTILLLCYTNIYNYLI